MYRNNASVTFFYPPDYLINTLKDVNHDVTSKEFYSNKNNTFEQYLVAKWTITDLGIVKKLFGTALDERFYSDSVGVVDFQSKKGGKLIPEISVERPVKLSYNTYLTELNVQFYFMKLKAFPQDNGSVIYKTVI